MLLYTNVGDIVISLSATPIYGYIPSRSALLLLVGRYSFRILLKVGG